VCHIGDKGADTQKRGFFGNSGVIQARKDVFSTGDCEVYMGFKLFNLQNDRGMSRECVTTTAGAAKTRFLSSRFLSSSGHLHNSCASRIFAYHIRR